jgi:uncharacterized RDD family membrane protein YckC
MKAVILAVAAAVLIALPAPARAAQGEVTVVEGVHFSNPALRIGQDYTLKAGDSAREVVVIAGDATIEGRVDSDVVVIFGKAQLAGTAVIEGSLVIVGGTASIGEGAQVHEDLFVLGGYEGAPGFSAGGQHTVIGTAAVGTWFRTLVPWLTHGLLWGRPIVPWLPWVWAVAGVFFLISLLLNMVFDVPVRAATVPLRATPLSAFMTGLLVMLLAGPMCFVLAISVIGIAVVPFVLCALLVAALLGKVAFARWIGMSVFRQEDIENRAQSFRSFLLGSAIMCVAYMIPVLGLVTWTMAGVFGLGASTLAFFSAYRRENPKKPKKVKFTPVEVPADAVAAPGSAASLEAVAENRAAAPMAADANADIPLTAMPMADAVVEEPRAYVAAAAAPAGSAGVLMFPRGAFLERLAAFTLDFILIVIVAQVLDLDRHVDAPLGRVGLLLAVAYHVGFWTWRGTTLGGIICNLRVVRVDGRPMQFAEALVRSLTGVFSLAVLGLGFLWIVWDPERQAWHDRVAGTYVVKVPRAYPI